MSNAAGTDHPLELPDRRLFWQWVWSAVRPYVGWVLAAAGGAALLAGWFGVSGEALTAKQMPYLVSGGLAGVALVILAGVFLATDDIRRQFARIGDLERKVDQMYALFVTELGEAGDGEGDDGGGVIPDGAAPATARQTTARQAAVREATAGYVALPGGTSYHRPDCSLVAGKSNATAVDASAVAARGLRPCRVCEPGPVADPG
jgi:hypothetical protein